MAGTGNKYLLSKWAKLSFRAKVPITGTMVAYDSHAFVLPISRDDLIIGIDNIVQHMIPLTIELMLEAQHDYRESSTSSFPAYIPGITGDVYALAAMGSKAEETAPPLPQSQSTLVPLEPWNKASRMVPAPVHKKVYQPLKGEKSAPEDEVHAHAGIFGDVDKLTAQGYTSMQAFSARKAEALERMKVQVSLPAEDPAHEKFTNMLTDNVAAFVRKYWTGIKVDPVHIEFLPSLPETIRCASRAYPPEILPRMQSKMEAWSYSTWSV